MADQPKQPASPPKPAEGEPKLERLKEIPLPSSVLALDVTPDGHTLFAACQDGGVFTVDAASGRAERLAGHESYASGVALLPGGQTLISAGYDGVLQWHDLAARKTVRAPKRSAVQPLIGMNTASDRR